jgi:hypothetical protein
VTGGAAAALLGLLFVSVSINAAAALAPGRETSSRLAEQAFQNYLAVILVSLLALYPQVTMPSFGLSVLCVTAVSSVWVLIRLYLTMARPHEARLMALRRHFGSLVGFGAMIFAAAKMALNQGVDLNLFATGVLVLLGSATVVSWELLVRMARGGGPPAQR